MNFDNNDSSIVFSVGADVQHVYVYSIGNIVMNSNSYNRPINKCFFTNNLIFNVENLKI